VKEIISILGFVQSVYGMLLLGTKRPTHLSFKILVLWLAVIAVFLGAGLMPFEVIDYYKPGIFPILFLFGPILYLYVCSLVKENFRLGLIHMLHLLPLIFVSLHRSISDVKSISTFLEGENFTFTVNSVYYVLLIISTFIYWIYSVKLVVKHHKNIPFYFSNYSRRNSLNWLILVALLFLLLFFTDLLFTLLDKFVNSSLNQFFSLPVNLTIFVFTILYFGINQSIIYESRHKAEKIPDEKYKRSVLEQQTINEINHKVEIYLKERKPYLNPDFSFQMMVDDLEISRHALSQAINSKKQKNFYNLINEFRVNEVKRKLLNKEFKKLTVIGIAFECGFNSKTTFNRIFKDHIGMTPTEFIKMLD